MKEIPRAKTQIGDRIRITSVPFGVSNLSVGIEGETIASPEIINDFVQVKVKLDDGRIVTWKESNLEIIEDVPPTEEVKKTEIDLINRDGKLYAKVKDLRKHPLNDKIYDSHNIERLCAEIKASGWIEALVITPDGKTISGNSRLECCRKLNKEEVEVRVREFKNEDRRPERGDRRISGGDLERKRPENNFKTDSSNSKFRENNANKKLSHLRSPTSPASVEAFLLANSYRVKTNEELIREGLLREEVESRKAALRQKAGVKVQHLEANWPQGSQDNQDKRNPQSRDVVAKTLGIGARTYSRGKKVVEAIESLKSENKLGAAKQLKKTLNNKSFNAAFNQVNDLEKIKGAIESLKKTNQNDASDILENILKNHSIKDGIEQMNEWQKDYKRRMSNFQHLDVVRIKSEEQKGEWGILDVYDEEKLTGVVMTVLGELQVQLVNLERIELNDQDKKAAYDLMIRLQRSSYQLQGKNEPLAHQIIQYIAKKQSPDLSILEEVYLLATEVFLIGAIEEIRKRTLEVLKFKYKEQKKLKIKN